MRVVIVGAGISGLSLAAFLRRVNIDCVVLEQAPFLHANFHLPVTLFANALSCFKAYGFECFFENGMCFPEDHFGVRDETGKWLMKVRNRDVSLGSLGEQDIIPTSTAPPANSESVVSCREAEATKLEMGRVPFRTTFSSKRLKTMLRQFAPEIRYGAKVVDLMPHDGIKGGVHCVLEDGTTEWGDVVVGADGMHSTIRKLLYPDEYVGTSSKSLNMMTIDGITDTNLNLTETLGDMPCEFWGRKKTVSYYPLFNQGESRVAFSATLYQSPQELVDQDAASAMNDMEYRQIYRSVLAREFAEFPPELISLFKNAAVAVPTELLEVPIMPRWFNKRAMLIGEAAHGSIPSFLGQDASLCVEDAALLAASLVDVPLSTDRGFEYSFKTFENVRRDRIEKYIRHSRKARKFTSTDFVGGRNMLLQAVPGMAMIKSMKWLAHWTYTSQLLDIDPKLKIELRYRL